MKIDSFFIFLNRKVDIHIRTCYDIHIKDVRTC